MGDCVVVKMRSVCGMTDAGCHSGINSGSKPGGVSWRNNDR